MGVANHAGDKEDRGSLCRVRGRQLRRLLAALGVFLVVICVVFLAVSMLRIRRKVLEGACGGQLTRLSLALEAYTQDYGTLPPAYVAGPDGTPMHSWRVLILPYLEEDDFYRQYRLNEPWDSPHNLSLARSSQSTGEAFQCPRDPGAEHGWTSYVAIVGPNTLWPGAVPPTRDKMSCIRHSILLVEKRESGILWTEPTDLTYEDGKKGLEAFSPDGRPVHVVLAWGTIGLLDEEAMHLRVAQPNVMAVWAGVYPTGTGVADNRESDEKGTQRPPDNAGN